MYLYVRTKRVFTFFYCYSYVNVGPSGYHIFNYNH
jgi:hypothetical protein